MIVTLASPSSGEQMTFKDLKQMMTYICLIGYLARCFQLLTCQNLHIYIKVIWIFTFINIDMPQLPHLIHTFYEFSTFFSMHFWQPPRSQGLCTGLSAWGNTHLVNEAGAVAQALGFSEIWPDHFFGPVATMMVNHFLLRPYFPLSIASHDGLSEWWWVVEWNGMDWDEIAGRIHSSMPRRIPPWHYTSQNCGWWPQVTPTGFWTLHILSQIFPSLSKLPTSCISSVCRPVSQASES